MTVSTASNDYAKKQLQNQIRNYKKLGKENTAIRKGTNQAKIKQSIKKGVIQLTHSAITIATTKNYREKHNTTNSC